MNLIFVLLISFFCCTSLFAIHEFYVEPITLVFPKVLLTSNGAQKKASKHELTYFGNFPHKLITLTPKQNKSFDTPFAVLEDLLYMFQHSEDFREIETLISPSLSEKAKSFFINNIKHPKFKSIARKKREFNICGYFLDKNTCVILYITKSKKGYYGCPQFTFIFENNRWYLGDQLQGTSEKIRYLTPFLSFFYDDIKKDLKLIIPPTQENLSLLKNDNETFCFYNKLVSFYRSKNIRNDDNKE